MRPYGERPTAGKLHGAKCGVCSNVSEQRGFDQKSVRHRERQRARDEIRTAVMLPCPFCRGIYGVCECEIIDLETHRKMLLEAGKATEVLP